MKTLNLPLVVLMPDALAEQVANIDPRAKERIFYGISTTKNQRTEILNFDDTLRTALYCAFLKENPEANIMGVNNIGKSNLSYSNENASLAGHPIFKEIPHGIYFGESIFENGSDFPQSFTFPSFTQKIVNTFTTEVKWGISKDTEVNFSFFDTKFNFSFNKSESETSATEITLESPSQTITVPVGRKYKMTTYLASSEEDVYVNLNEDISGQISGNIVNQYGSINFATKIGDAFDAMDYFGLLPHTITVKNSDKIHFNGLKIISASNSNSTIYNVKMENITNR